MENINNKKEEINNIEKQEEQLELPSSLSEEEIREALKESVFYNNLSEEEIRELIDHIKNPVKKSK